MACDIWIDKDLLGVGFGAHERTQRLCIDFFPALGSGTVSDLRASQNCGAFWGVEGSMSCDEEYCFGRMYSDSEWEQCTLRQDLDWHEYLYIGYRDSLVAPHGCLNLHHRP